MVGILKQAPVRLLRLMFSVNIGGHPQLMASASRQRWYFDTYMNVGVSIRFSPHTLTGWSHVAGSARPESCAVIYLIYMNVGFKCILLTLPV